MCHTQHVRSALHERSSKAPSKLHCQIISDQFYDMLVKYRQSDPKTATVHCDPTGRIPRLNPEHCVLTLPVLLGTVPMSHRYRLRSGARKARIPAVEFCSRYSKFVVSRPVRREPETVVIWG